MKVTKNGITIFLVTINLLVLAYFYYRLPKIGYVRNKILVEKFEGVKESRAIYTKKLGDWQRSVDTIDMILEKDLIAFENEKGKLPPAMKVFREHQLQEKIKVLEAMKADIQGKASTEETRLSQAAFNQINAMVEEYAKEHHYDMILGTTSDGNLMFGSESHDITEEVLKALNKKYKGE